MRLYDASTLSLCIYRCSGGHSRDNLDCALDVGVCLQLFNVFLCGLSVGVLANLLHIGCSASLHVVVGIQQPLVECGLQALILIHQLLVWSRNITQAQRHCCRQDRRGIKEKSVLIWEQRFITQ